MKLGSKSLEVILGIVLGTRPHADLKEAFDWEAYGPSYRFWAQARHAATLPKQAEALLKSLLKHNGITV